MSIEAMSKAYEALNKSRPFDADNARMQRDAMDALRTAIQQSKSKHRHWSEALADDLAESDDIQTDTHPATHQAEAKTDEPYGWAVTGCHSLYRGEWAEDTARSEAKRCGGTARAFPLYTHPAPGVPDDVARDAISLVREQYRGTDWGKAAECICDAIDTAMLAAAAQAQKGQQ